MSETLRDLVVSLSLQSDNFTRNIRSVNKQIQEAESRFKLAAAGVEGFEKTATRLTAQLSTLERRLSLQRDVVTQYQRALVAADNKLLECVERQGEYAQRLEDAKKVQQALKEQVGAAAKQVRTFSSTLGDTIQKIQKNIAPALLNFAEIVSQYTISAKQFQQHIEKLRSVLANIASISSMRNRYSDG